MDARNRLEGYLFQVKQSLDEYGSRLPEQDRTKAREVVDSALKWLEGNQMAEKVEFEEQLNEVQRVCSPILAKLHQQQQSGPSSGLGSCEQQFGGRPAGGTQRTHGGGAGQGPTVEEVD